jgi:pimeloyl-ACP methyl ester carboxylesterase
VANNAGYGVVELWRIQRDGDVLIPTRLSHLMAGLIREARIGIYPDSAHAFLFQEPEQVAADVNAFLS